MLSNISRKEGFNSLMGFKAGDFQGLFITCYDAMQRIHQPKNTDRTQLLNFLLANRKDKAGEGTWNFILLPESDDCMVFTVLYIYKLLSLTVTRGKENRVKLSSIGMKDKISTF